MTRHDQLSPWLARGMYVFGLAFIVTAGIDLFTTVWPVRPTDMAWRYGFLGLSAGYLQTPTLGLLLILLTAWWEGRVLLVKAVGVVCVVGALALLPAMGLFALDVLTMRAVRAAEMQSAVMAGGVFQEVKYALSAVVLGCMGFGALSSAKSMARAAGGGAGAPGIVSSGSAGRG